MRIADVGGGIRLRAGSQTTSEIADKMNNAKISVSCSSLPISSLSEGSLPSSLCLSLILVVILV